MDYHHLLEAAGIAVSGVLLYSLAYGWFPPDENTHPTGTLPPILDTERSTTKRADDAGG